MPASTPGSPQAVPLLDPIRFPILSLYDLQKAQNSLDDFLKTYPSYYGKTAESALKHLSVLTFVESLIYRADCLNEELSKASTSSVPPVDPSKHTHARKRLRSRTPDCIPSTSTVDTPSPDQLFKRPEDYVVWLRQLLDSLGHLTPSVDSFLDEGLRFWALEREFNRDPHAFPLDRAKETSRLKSFDIRLLHAVYRSLEKIGEDEGLLEFLRLDEHLLDVGDDLVDYEDDIEEKGFNLYRAFVSHYGKEAPAHLIAYITENEARLAELEGKLTELQKKAVATRRVTAAREEGCGFSWFIPEPIIEKPK